MMVYLLKFVLCSGILLLVYRLLLANESMYRFNRMYLLFSLVFSLIVPAITMSLPATAILAMEQPVIKQSFTPTADTQIAVPIYEGIIQQPAPVKRDYLPMILLALYGMVTAFLLARFIINLYRISRAASKSTAVIYKDTRVLLTNQELTPHSFLNYVFINQSDYRDGLIEPEIICHEQTHVRQLHSVDVLLIELLQAVCWFNPFVPFYRRAIQLNHEFLADEAVIQHYQDTPAYQYLLLAKAGQKNSLQLTSQFNYLTTKKRLIMMTKTRPSKMAVIKQLALAPVLAGALLLFSQKIMAQTVPATTVSVGKKATAAKQNAPQSIIDEYATILAKYKLKQGMKREDLKGMDIWNHHFFSDNDKARLVELYKQMSSAQQKQQMVMFRPSSSPLPKCYPTEKQLSDWKNAAEYGVWIDGKKVKNEELNKYKASDFDEYFISRLYGAAKTNVKYHYQLDLMTKPYYANYYKGAKAEEGVYRMWLHMPPLNEKAANTPKGGVSVSDNLVDHTANKDVNKPPTVLDRKILDKPVSADKGINTPLIILDGKVLDKQIPADFDFATADKDEYAALLSVLPVDISDVSIFKNARMIPLAGNITATSILRNAKAEVQWGDGAKNGLLIINTKIEQNK